MSKKNIQIILESSTNVIPMNSNHYHIYYEIYYLLNGNTRYFINNKTFSLISGDIAIICPVHLHKTFNTENTLRERILIYFDQSYFDDIKAITGYSIHDFYANSRIIRPDDPLKQSIHRLFKDLHQLSLVSKDTDEAVKKLKFMQLLIQLSNVKTTEKDAANKMVMDKLTEKIILYIENNYHHKITLDHLSELFYLNKYKLCKDFKSETGFTVIEYINLVRLNKARKLIDLGYKNITNVGVESGFDSSAYFIKLFKKQFNITPKQYQLKIKK